MKSFTLMPESRMDLLMKVAEDCIGLMGLDVEPNAALRKIATDHLLTDKEVELVSHAINNSRQLAQFEQSDADSRDKPFPLTNAELVNKDRYGPAGVDSDHAEQAKDQPDAVEIADKLQKEAAASNQDFGDYRRRTSRTLTEDSVRAQLGIPSLAKVASNALSPVHPAQAYDVGIDEARTRAASATDRAADLLRKVGSAFTHIIGPSFADFERVADASGVDATLVSAIYDDCDLAKYGAARWDARVKTARVYASQDLVNLVEMVKQASECVDDAASALAAKAAFEGYRDGILAKTAQVFSPGLSQEVEKGPQAYLGLGADPNKAVMDIAGEYQPEGSMADAILPNSVTQELKNVDTQSQLKELLQDQYIKGYSLPEVISAFNAAKSVNPNFGNAQMTSYVRQHLATDGGIPLELQARTAARPGDSE